MKRKFTKITSCLLCLAMLFSMAMPALAVRADDEAIPIDAPAPDEDGGSVLDLNDFFEDAEASLLANENPFDVTGEYEIYPTPHSVTYADSTVTLPATMQVTYTGSIDSYTKDRAVEAFQQAGVTLSESASTAVKLQVSIKADGDGVTTATANLFDKTSAYKLTIDANGVTVVGVDTDAAFYGLTTVKRILQQVTGKQVKHLTVEDYADVPFRGFIEGYYGNPWTVEDRAALMKFGGELKMNIYFYAPKDDPKHSTKWRELYTQEELETKIRPLAEAGNKSKCYYGFALHPFWAEGINYSDEAQYAADLEVLKAKFEQVMKVGVRQIAVLADDRGLPNVASGNTEAQNTRASYVRLMTDLTEWVSSAEMQEKYPGLKTSIPFCPNDYMGNASSAQMQTLKELPDSVPIIQTGGAIWGSVSNSYLTTYRNNMGDKGTFMWINWPCSDQSKSSLIMGAHDTVLRSDLTQDDIGTLRGIMLNPMQQSEPSKAAIFQNADYAWNVWNGSDSAQRIADVWDDCFKYVDHDSAIETAESAALRELAKHMIHNNGSGWRGDWHESAVLKDTLSAFRDKLSTNSLTADDITAMRREFETLHDAAVLYKGKTSGNLRILGQRKSDGTYVDNQEQMAPWLDYWVEFTQANLDFLDTLSLLQSNSDGSKNAEIISKYLSGQNNLTAANSHSFLYVNHYESALAGGEYIAPFTDVLQSTLAEKAGYLLRGEEEPLIETVITNRGTPNEGTLESVRDGDLSTYISFHSPASAAVGDYIGVLYNRSTPIDSIRFDMGDAGQKNSFTAAKLEYTEDGVTWQDVPGTPTVVMGTGGNTGKIASIEQTGLGLSLKGIRLTATAAVSDIYLSIKEITINGKSGSEPEQPAIGEQYSIQNVTLGSLTVASGQLSSMTDGNPATIVMLKNASGADNCPANAYVELNLGSEKPVGSIVVTVDSSKPADSMTATVQYWDGSAWQDIQSGLTESFTAEFTSRGITTSKLRLLNPAEKGCWIRFAEVAVYGPTPGQSSVDKILYQSDAVKKITNPVGELADDKASLAADNVMLRPGEFVGISLPTPRRVTDIVADYTPAPGLVLKVGMNEAELEVVNFGAAQLFANDSSVIDYNAPARYVRLENEGEQTISFQLNELSVQSEEPPSGIHFLSSTVGGEANNEDARKLGTTGNWFDGNVDTKAKFCASQVSGQHVTYDLGQTRQIRDLRLIVQDSQMDYPRHAKVQISASADGPWTDVITIDTSANASTSAGNDTEGGWVNISAYPNYKSLYNELVTPQNARYLRVLFTENFGDRWLELNEIVINGGDTAQAEYVSAYSDPTIEVDPIEPSANFTPDKLIDGNLTTGFRPNMDGVTSGSLIYRLSDETSIGQINLVQGETSGVKLAIRPVGETQFKELATLTGGLNQTPINEDITGVAEIKLSWDNVTPTFYELITIPRAAVVEGGGQAPSEVETIPINSYSGDARKVNFDENWKFNLGDVSGAEAQVFNDSAWRTINLPHDFSIDQPYSGSGCEAESGWLPGGTGWYRKSFTVSPDWENNKVVSIDFGGAYMETDVYLNGHKLGENKNGYNPFSFVLPSEYLNYTGENVIAVKVVNTIPSSRWYSGSGIYRSVNLTVTSPVHVARYGTYVNPVKGSGNDWTVNIKTNVQNDTASAANVTVEQAIYALDSATYKKTGAAVATDTSSVTSVNANANGEVTQTISVSNPSLWNSWDRGTPNLYVLVTTVKQGSTVVDTYETEFGFRTIEFTTDEGFKLNGVSTKLKGVCQHHDQGALGAEAWYRAMERQVEILMDMGCNSIRVTHNPADDGLIEICNRKGILIIDEAFDCWDRSKNSNGNDFARFFNTAISSDNTVVGGEGRVWSQFVLETMVNRDKNAPCVIMYSLGNEILQTSPHAGFIQIIKNLEKWAHDIDSSRPVTMGDDSRNTNIVTDENTNAYASFVNTYLANHNGVIGFNYCNTRPGSGRDKMPAAHNNGWLTYGSETASHINSRGIYNIKGSGALNGDKLLTSYDKSRVGWGDSAAGAWWYTVRFDYNMGEYVWTGFDYIGEPTPANGTTLGAGWNETAPKNSYFGIIDTNGIPKDNYYLYRSMWNETDTTLHVLPTWDREDLMVDSNGKVEVVVYSNAPTVRVYLNGEEVGASHSTETTTAAGHKYRTYEAAALQNGGTNTFTPGSTDHGGDLTGTAMYSTFNVPYAEGTLEVKAFDENGHEITKTVGRDMVRTTSGVSKLVATADRKTIKNDGRDLSYVTIDVVDAKGEIVNGATPEIKVSVTGDGKFMGLDNGVQPDHTSYTSDTRKAGAGRLVAIIQSTKEEGSFTVTATSAGLTPAAVTVSTGGAVAETGGDTPVSYDLSKTIYVQLNTEPELPQKATVTLGNGNQVEKAITWKEYDKSLLATPGVEFAITGVIADYNTPISIGVVVLDNVVALLNYSAAVQVGQVPSLPASRPAVMADGTVVNAQFAVTWDELPENATRKAGKVIVNGTAEVFGETYNVTATIRVAAPSYVDGGEATSGTTYYVDGASVGSSAANTRPYWADGDLSTVWTGSEAIGYSFDTAQNVHKIALTYQGTPPTGGVTIAVSGTNYSSTEAAQGWQTVHVTRTVSGNTVTYQMDKPFSAEAVKLTFAGEVHLADVVLTTGLAVFDIGSTAELDDMKINGQPVSASQLAAKSIRTPAINGVIHPISDHNVAVTILPENKNSQIILVTESENHAERAVYTVQLDAGSNPTAEDDSMDYPYTKTTATAPSQNSTSGNNSASAAVDGNPSTIWHTSWSGNDAIDLANQPERRYIQLKLDEVTKLAALRYLPRSDGKNGRIIGYEVWVSTADTVTAESKDTFTKVSEGDWAENTDWKLATFTVPADAKYVRLYGVRTQTGNAAETYVSAAEIRLVKAPDTSKIDLSEAILTVEPNEFEWKNVGIRPGTGTEGATVTVTLRGKVLTLHEDYELGYENNIDPGTAYIYARAKDGTNYQGAAAATFTIVKTDAKITSFRPVTVPVQPGIDPTDSLPKTVMAFTDSADGLPMEVEVTWDDVPAEWYNFPEEKTRTLTGTVDPDLLSNPDLKPTATLKFAYSQSVDSISMVTAVGVIPALPDTVTVQFDDGTSGRRTVSKWYVKGDATKAALTTADFAAEGTVELEGDIVGIDRVKAAATVRVAEADQPTGNIALNDSEQVHNGNGHLTSIGSIFPMAIASESSGDNNPYHVLKGQTAGSTNSADRWSDWEKNPSGAPHITHTSAWVGVAFETSTANVTAQANQVLTLVPHKVNKAKVMFTDENANNDGQGAVTYPASYTIQYYDGPLDNLKFNTQLSSGDSGGGNGRVDRSWDSNSPLKDSQNWKSVTVKGSAPAVPTSRGQWVEVEFEPVDTAIIRVLCTPKSGKWVGVQALEVYGLTPAANSDFTVTSVTLGGEEKLDSFVTDSAVTSGKMLEVTLPAGSGATANIPKLAITATNNASISVVQAVRVPGLPQAGGAWAQAVVTSEDGSKTETYTVKFTREGAAAGFFIELDEKFPKDKLQLVDAAGHPVSGGTPNAEITLQIAKGYQAQVWVEITEGDRMGEVLVLSNTNNSFLMPAASVHVYGSAMPITYNIKYLLNGGSFVGDPRVTYNVETATFSVNDPTRAGYTFKGWVGGGLTQPTTGLTIEKGSIGDRTYTAVWETNATIGGGGGNNGGGSVSVPVGDVTVTTKNPDGSTTVTTTTSGGLVSAVTTAPDGTQSAVIQIPQNSGTPTKAVMPALDVNAEKTPEVTIQNNTGRPLSVIVPVNGASTVVAIRTNADGSETVIPYSVMDENGLRVKIESDSQTLKLMDNKKTFDDVAADHWALDAVDFVSSRELFNGMGSVSTFAPTAPMDRAMMTTVLWRLAEKPNAAVTELFDDVQSGAYYEQAVAWGVATGVVKGTDNGFEPNSPVTRETLAVLLYRAAGSPAVVDELPRRFTDGAQVADWAQEAMIWCVQNDIIKGYPDNTLGAKNVATRAEVATMLQRFVIHQI